MPVVQRALEDLRACRSDEDAHKRLEAAFAPVGTLPGFSFDTKALDQLISNDSFLPFQPEETRKLLMSLSTRLNTMGRNSATLAAGRSFLTSDATQPGPLTPQSTDQIVEAIKAGAIPSPEMVRKRQLVVPLAEACKDNTLLNEFYTWEDMAYFHIIMGQLAADRVRADLEALPLGQEPRDDAFRALKQNARLLDDAAERIVDALLADPRTRGHLVRFGLL